MSNSSGSLKLCLACALLVAAAPRAGLGQRATAPANHGAVVVRPFSLGPNPTPVLQAFADSTRAHIVVGLKAAGVRILDRAQRPVRANDLTNLVAAHFAILGVVGSADSQVVLIARLATMDGDSLNQVRLLGPPASAAAFGDSLATLFAPTILARPNVRP